MAIDWQSRRDGFDHRTDKPTDRPINWKYWASLPALKQWEACALSVNVNPDNLKARRMVMPGMPVFLPESFPSRAVELEFNRRLTMFNRYAGGNHLAVVRPQRFAGWCLHVGLENLPPELVAMAAIEPAPVVTPEPPPVATAGALGGVELLPANAPKHNATTGPRFSMNKAALIANHEHEWPSIRVDIAGAADNELKAAKAGPRGWYEDIAMEWARAKGKLNTPVKPANELAAAVHSMANVPGRKHIQER